MGMIPHGFIDVSCSSGLKEAKGLNFLKKGEVTYVT
jgi:hypothetical protein